MKSPLCFLVYFISIWRLPANLEAVQPRIIAGQEASPGQFPWQAFLHITRNGSISYCGGSIISTEWIVTAAQCLYKVDSVKIYTRSDTVSQGGELVLHENYDPSTLLNDVALIKLEQPLILDEQTAAIILAQNRLEPGEDVIVSGWGATSDSADADMSPTLYYAYLTTVRDSECGEVFGTDHNDEGVLCAVSGTIVTSGPCKGDAGDPLVINVNNSATLVGIFSFGSDRCGGGFPFGFTRVSHYRNWIQEITNL